MSTRSDIIVHRRDGKWAMRPIADVVVDLAKAYEDLIDQLNDQGPMYISTEVDRLNAILTELSIDHNINIDRWKSESPN